MAKKKGHVGVSYTKALADQICERIANGESVRQICLIKGMPAEGTVWKWILQVKYFGENYARAKEKQADKFNEELIDIAEDGTNDWEERESERTGKTFIALNREAIERSKLRIETRKWVMGRMKPKKYGDKLDLTSGGEKLQAPPPYLGVRVVE